MKRRAPAAAGGGAASDDASSGNATRDGAVAVDEENRMVVRWSRVDEDEEYDEEYRLLVLKLGEYGINADGTLREDEAWDGNKDPCVHLPANERQEMMRNMKIGDIVVAGKKRKEQGNKGRRRRPWEQQRFVRRFFAQLRAVEKAAASNER